MEYDIDKFKEMADSMFDQFEPKHTSSEDKPKLLKASTPIPKDDADFAKQKALEEMESIRLAFVEFHDKVRDYMMFNYMTSAFRVFGSFAEDLTEMLEDDIDESQLSPEALKKYKSIKEFRAQILNNVFNKYKKK